jgi:hypothetical protein
MLEAGGRSLLRHAVEGFRSYFKGLPFLFIYRDIQGTGGFLQQEVARMGISQPVFAALEAPTRGQAETVAQGLRQVGTDPGCPVTIFNIDTIRPGFRMPSDPAIAESVGWLEVFPGSGRNWSFVRPVDPESTRVAEVAEKNPISDLCCTGLYHFSSAAALLQAFDAELADGPSQAGEFYIAPLYNRLLAQGADIRFALIGSDEVQFAGVPAEYEDLRQSYA